MKMRGMTKEEAQEYREGLSNIFKPTGRNIFELESESDELSELRKIVSEECPVGGLDIVSSLRAEKQHIQDCLEQIEGDSSTFIFWLKSEYENRWRFEDKVGEAVQEIIQEFEHFIGDEQN